MYDLDNEQPRQSGFCAGDVTGITLKFGVRSAAEHPKHFIVSRCINQENQSYERNRYGERSEA